MTAADHQLLMLLIQDLLSPFVVVRIGSYFLPKDDDSGCTGIKRSGLRRYVAGRMFNLIKFNSRCFTGGAFFRSTDSDWV